MEEDFIRHLLQNTPMEFPPSSLDWETHPSLSSISTLHELLGEDPNLTVDHRDEGISKRSTMTLKDFAQKIEKADPSESYYAKDIHIQQISSSPPCKFPSLFQDDWIESYYRYNYQGKDDYTFLYVGGPHSFTGLHFDVLCSYSVSYNIKGKKLWKLWSPSCQIHNRDASLSYDTMPSSESEDQASMIILQKEGETVFVPSGWYHTVQNLDPCVISINKNWLYLIYLL